MSSSASLATDERFDAAAQALSWKELRAIRSSLLSVPLCLVAATWLLSRLGTRLPLGELLVLALGPLLAALAGAEGMSDERREAGLDWLRARAVAPGRILRVKLAWQLVLLLVTALTVGLIASAWPGQAMDGWSEAFDAPAGGAVAFAALAWLAAFGWAAGLSWRSESSLAVVFGGLLLTWLEVALVTAPVALLSVRVEEILTRVAWLAPALLGPPSLFAAWCYRRWDPLATPRSARRWAALFFAVLALSLAGGWIAVQPALEARALLGGWTALPIRSVAELPHPRHEELRAHLLVFEDGVTRVVIDDGVASRVVLPRWTHVGDWLDGRSSELGVLWSDGSWRAVRPDGLSHPLPIGREPPPVLGAGGGS